MGRVIFYDMDKELTCVEVEVASCREVRPNVWNMRLFTTSRFTYTFVCTEDTAHTVIDEYFYRGQIDLRECSIKCIGYQNLGDL